MALTNDVGQSVICMLIFRGVGLELGGKVGPAHVRRPRSASESRGGERQHMSGKDVRRAATALGILLLRSFCAKAPERQAGSTANAAELPPTASSAGDPWTDLGISGDRQPQRLLIRKIVWRGGPEALVLEGAEVRRLHGLLAGNQRAAYACGITGAFTSNTATARSSRCPSTRTLTRRASRRSSAIRQRQLTPCRRLRSW